jgi:hypothetical protein
MRFSLVGCLTATAIVLSCSLPINVLAQSPPEDATAASRPEGSALPGSGPTAEERANADLQQVGSLTDDGATGALSGTGFTYRHNWGTKNGQWRLHLAWPAVRNGSRVLAAVGECSAGGGKFIGAARYTLHNVAPSDGNVSVWVNIEWGSPIAVCVDYLVVNPPGVGTSSDLNPQQGGSQERGSATGRPAAQTTQAARDSSTQASHQMAQGGPVSAELQGGGITYSHDWGARRGQWILNLNWNVIRRETLVFASVSECTATGIRFIGAARYTLHNIAQTDGRVSIWVNIDWGSPIRLCVDYLAINPRETPHPRVAVRLVNMVPAALGGETFQDSEPFLGVDIGDVSRMVGSAFTRNPNPTETGRAPVYISENNGDTWRIHTIIPSDGMTGDITVAGSARLKRLHSGILRRPGSLLQNILRSDDFLASTPMDVRVSRSQVDQPFVQTRRVANNDRIYVGNNDFGVGSQSAVVDVSLDDGATYNRVQIERRATSGQDGPSIRPAVSTRDDTIYVAYFGWRAFDGSTATSDIVVVRDDRGAQGTNPFRDLIDPSDNQPGRIVANRVSIPWSNAPTLGFERIGSTLSIAVDPSNSDVVYVGWADRIGDGDVYSIHVRRSTDRGVTWSSDLRVIRNAGPFSLAIAQNGTVGFLYQQFVGSGNGSRWITHLEQTQDAFVSRVDTILANVPGDAPARQFLPYIGDYNFMLTVGQEFRGIFSTSNAATLANFPNGVRYQRSVDFATNRLLDSAGNVVNPSIDPFYFSVSVVR